MTGRKSKHRKMCPSVTHKNPLCVGQLRLYVGAKIEALDSQKWYVIEFHVGIGFSRPIGK